MPQGGNHDELIVKMIDSGQITIVPKEGIAYGKSKDLHGNNKRIGFKNKNGDHLFSFRFEDKCFVGHVCRAVWLRVYGPPIPENWIVSHRDSDKENNSIFNLKLQESSFRRFNPKSWSESEVRWLKDNYPVKSLNQLAEECGRSVKAVRHKVKQIDLPPKRGKNKVWTQEEDEQLIALYSKSRSLKEICRRLDRTESSVRLRANRKLGLFRSDRHLQLFFRSKDFYHALKKTLFFRSAKSKCCLCNYTKHIQLHHIDGNNRNHDINNIASVCPNHHIEIKHGEHEEQKLYCIWWRMYSDGSLTDRQDNHREIQQRRKI